VSAIGSGMNNIAWAMLKGTKTPEELENIRAQAEDRRALTEYHRAMAAKVQAEADAAAAEQTQAPMLRDAFVQSAGGMTEPQMLAFREHQKTGSWGEPYEREITPGYGQSMVATPELHGITDAMVRGARAGDQAWLARGKGTADATMKGVTSAIGNQLRAEAAGGGAAPKNLMSIAQVDRALDSNQKLFDTSNTGVVTNLLTGAIDESGGLAKANIGTVKQHGAAYGAQAFKDTQQGNKAKAETALVDSESRLMPITDPETGQQLLDGDGKPMWGPMKLVLPNTTRVFQANRAGEAREHAADVGAAAKGAGKAGGKDPKLNPKEETAIDDALGLLVPSDMTIPGEQKSVLRAWAREYFSAPDSPARGNIDKAATMAYTQVYGKPKPEGNGAGWVPFMNDRPGGSVNMELPPPRGGGVAGTMAGAVKPGQQQKAAPRPITNPPVTAQPQAAQPAAGAVPPPAQRVVGQIYTLPKGRFIWMGTGWSPADA
jgi:hypothetical protein